MPSESWPTPAVYWFTPALYCCTPDVYWVAPSSALLAPASSWPTPSVRSPRPLANSTWPAFSRVAPSATSFAPSDMVPVSHRKPVAAPATPSRTTGPVTRRRAPVCCRVRFIELPSGASRTLARRRWCGPVLGRRGQDGPRFWRRRCGRSDATPARQGRDVGGRTPVHRPERELRGQVNGGRLGAPLGVWGTAPAQRRGAPSSGGGLRRRRCLGRRGQRSSRRPCSWG